MSKRARVSSKKAGQAKESKDKEEPWTFPEEKDRLKPENQTAPYWACLCITKKKDYQYCVSCFSKGILKRWVYDPSSGVRRVCRYN